MTEYQQLVNTMQSAVAELSSNGMGERHSYDIVLQGGDAKNLLYMRPVSRFNKILSGMFAIMFAVGMVEKVSR